MKSLLIEFKLNMSTREYEQLGETVAPEIARVSGLIRKTWLWNEQTQEAGGVYVFENQDALDGYLKGPIVHQLRGMHQVTGLRARVFDVLEHASSITRGIEQPAAKATLR